MLEPARSSRPESRAAGKRAVAFDLKGSMAPLTVLRLRVTDLALIERQLRVKIAQMPQLFVDVPVLLDLGALGDEAGSLAFGELAQMLRACKLVPVAVSNAPDELRARAVEAGFGVLAPQVAPRAAEREEVAAPAAPAPEPAAPAPSPVVARPHTGPVVVTQAVRGGQVIHARDNDLVVLAPVNPGAQVIADGHVHIYSTLRGRAVAGASGLLGARIFCQKLEAELVAISGAYVMADEIPADRRGKPATIYLDNGECRISAL
ncbi:MAG TPA: septum site-determining protein MinC [Polyangia bacterium]|nr:septum site-determining protein MinC [Polyangia bacterium]